MAKLEFTPDEAKYLLTLFNHIFQKGGIGAGDAVMILKLADKVQALIPPEQPQSEPVKPN